MADRRYRGAVERLGLKPSTLRDRMRNWGCGGGPLRLVHVGRRKGQSEASSEAA